LTCGIYTLWWIWEHRRERSGPTQRNQSRHKGGENEDRGCMGARVYGWMMLNQQERNDPCEGRREE